MSLNIIDLVKGQLGPALVSQAATKLGESESGISKAIGGLLPMVLGGLTDNVGKPGVFDAIKGAATSGILGNLLGGSSDNSIISSILPLLFGDKKEGIVGEIAKFAGISNDSTNSVLNMVTGATLGSVGKYAADNNLDASGVSSLLEGEKSGLSALLPAGLSLGSLGLGGVLGGLFNKAGDAAGAVVDTVSNVASGTANVVKDATGAVVDTAGDVASGTANAVKGAAGAVVDTAGDVASGTANAVKGAAGAAVGAAGAAANKVGDTASKVVDSATSFGSNDNNNNEGGSIWKWLLPLLLLLGLSFFLWKQCNKADADASTTETEEVVTDENGTTGDDVAVNSTERTTLEVELPNGVKLNAYEGGIESQVVEFLKSDDYKNATEDDLKTRWFNFDNLNFEFGTTTLTEESKVQLENLKQILAAFPDAKIKIGAYTDKKGDDTVNKNLSQKRADAVNTALNSTQVVKAEGYGEEFAEVAEDASDEEREADRKTAIRFVK